MKHYEFNWFSTDGKQVYAQVWQPESGLDIKAAICIIHGMGEHSGRYKDMAHFFVKNGFGVLSFDLLGHGQSEGKRGCVSSYDVLSDQVDRALEEASKRFPGHPKFIYGHSLGGNILLDYCLRRNPRVLGVVVSAPWLRTVEEIPGSKVWLCRVMNMFYPSYTENNGIDTAFLSRDPQVATDYEEDELVHSKVSARLFLGGYEHAAIRSCNVSDVGRRR